MIAYQTAPRGQPATLKLALKARAVDKVTIEATLFDANGILCLDARNRVRFALVGAGALDDNLGTSTGSRVIELYNGRAEISLVPGSKPSAVSVASEQLPEAFLRIE